MDSEQRTLEIAKIQNELNSSREMNLAVKKPPQSQKKVTKFKLIKNLVKKNYFENEEQIQILIIPNPIAYLNYFFIGRSIFSKLQIKVH